MCAEMREVGLFGVIGLDHVGHHHCEKELKSDVHSPITAMFFHLATSLSTPPRRRLISRNELQLFWPAQDMKQSVRRLPTTQEASTPIHNGQILAEPSPGCSK
ncbi:uncharacterized protein LOC121600404 [Anopheles merus]|uniref:uncharacterized protein LOC121600404 n=1 Tax=Anopheles merus TaxID=30066 RepID=UPI001BE49A92|nr:uncharacterized protein LOC121600404 [Anopheles merus]